MSSAHDSKAPAGGESSRLAKAAAAYIFGVNPGDESEPSEAQLREYASRVLEASGYPYDLARLAMEIQRLREALERARRELESGPVAVSEIEYALDQIDAALAARSVQADEASEASERDRYRAALQQIVDAAQLDPMEDVMGAGQIARRAWWVACKHGQTTGPYGSRSMAFRAALMLWDAYGSFVDERRRS